MYIFIGDTPWYVYVLYSILLRYHMMRNLINEGGCLSSVRRLPGAVCSCLGCSGCSEESPVQAAPGLDIMRNFLREPNLRYLQVRVPLRVYRVFHQLSFGLALMLTVLQSA